MNPADLPLRDIHLPPPPGWWPPAPGWWLLAALLLAAVIGMAVWLRRRWRKARHRAALEAELAQALALDTPSAQLVALSQLLRRAALQVEPQAATLTGEAWLRWLDGADASVPFSSGPGRVLLEGPYRAQGVDHPDIAHLLPILRPRFIALATPKALQA